MFIRLFVIIINSRMKFLGLNDWNCWNTWANGHRSDIITGGIKSQSAMAG